MFNLYKFVSNSINEKLGFNVILETPKNREFGDFATNAAMVMAKKMGKNPRELATEIIPQISELEFVDNASIAGPGFINIKIKDNFIWESANQDAEIKDSDIKTIVMDYGSYNVGKSLHIGHLRTSIVGDTLNNVAKFLGHKTVSYNHLGDWGRPMGLVISYIKMLHPDWTFFQDDFDESKINPDDYIINETELSNYYPLASAKAKEDPEFMEQAQQTTAQLQNGHPGYTSLYNIFLKISLNMMDKAISSLNMTPFDKTLGERNASENVPEIEKLLRNKNLVEKSDGAEIVQIKRDTDTKPMPPFMLHNSRGADTYDATDLAAIYYRKKHDNPDMIWYFTDLRQILHFQQVFRVSEMMGLFPSENLEHLYFGTINGPGGKAFKTRDGNVAGLLDIIEMVNDAVQDHVSESGKELDSKTIKQISLAALKFNDLMHDLKSDYIFDPKIITSFEGKTGPYILYTAVRLNSVLKKSENTKSEIGNVIEINTDERNLLISLMEFPRVIKNIFNNRTPDLLANYTYDLCGLVNTFYHNCPILKDDIDEQTRAKRLKTTKLATKTLNQLISMMGLEIPSKM